MTASLQSKRTRVLGGIGWFAVSFTAAALGALASVHAQSFYEALTRPTWAPPAAVFGPVWSLLYTMMATAAFLVWRSGGFRAHPQALTVFLVQLVLNALWSWLFFFWHRGAYAQVDIVLLWLLIVAAVVSFWRVRPVAGVLLMPYLAWVSFASALNYSVWTLNPGTLG
jgi:tryptophan-rich sensory protein